MVFSNITRALPRPQLLRQNNPSGTTHWHHPIQAQKYNQPHNQPTWQDYASIGKLQDDIKGHDEWQSQPTNGRATNNCQQCTGSPQPATDHQHTTSSDGGLTASSDTNAPQQAPPRAMEPPLPQADQPERPRHDDKAVATAYHSHGADQSTGRTTCTEHALRGLRSQWPATRYTTMSTHSVKHQEDKASQRCHHKLATYPMQSGERYRTSHGSHGPRLWQDDELMNYRQLMKHPKFNKAWTKSSANEFGRLASGVGGQ